MSTRYEEDQFARFFEDELARTVFPRARIAPVARVIEAKVGFDQAWFAPRWHPIWRRAGLGHLPGLGADSWGPELERDTAIRTTRLNLFVQYKRSLLMKYRGEYHAQLGNPYWQFRVDRKPGKTKRRSQHDELVELEKRSAGHGVVRYVAPYCHDYATLETWSDARRLARNCVYVAPSKFEPQHNLCAFSRAQIEPIINPEPESISGTDYPTFTGELSGLLAIESDFGELIAGVAATCRAIDPESDSLAYAWRRRPEPIDDSTAELLNNYSVAAQFMFRRNIAWLVGIGDDIH